jgi:hypothetical protein
MTINENRISNPSLIELLQEQNLSPEPAVNPIEDNNSRLSDKAGECFRAGTSGRSSEGTSTGEGSKNSLSAEEENEKSKTPVFFKILPYLISVIVGIGIGFGLYFIIF